MYFFKKNVDEKYRQKKIFSQNKQYVFPIAPAGALAGCPKGRSELNLPSLTARCYFYFSALFLGFSSL